MNFTLASLLPTKKKAGTLSPIDNRGGWWPLIREAFAGAWQKNIEWKQEDLLSSPIVFSCITLIANDIGKLRSRLVDRKDGIWSEVENVSPFWPVLRKPNRYQNQIQFKQWWITSKLTKGNAYALKERDQRGVVVKLYILDPLRTTPLITEDGAVYYQLSQDLMAGVGQTGVVVPASEIIHDRMNCLYHPLVGVSPLYAAAIAAGVGIEIQKNTARFFTNSSNPGGILVAPGAISPDNAKAIKEQWQANYTGVNAGKVAVIGEGMTFQPLGQKAVDSQLIETLRWSDERVCSVFHVPPYKVGAAAAPSYNNIEALQREYYDTCLQILIEEFEACMDEGLDLDGHSRGVDLDLDGLLRMDSKTQMETISSGISAKVLTIDDGRKKINLPPIEGGDTVYMQQQDYPISEIRNNKLTAPAPVVPVVEPVSDSVSPDQEDTDNSDAMKALAERVDGLEQAVADRVSLSLKNLFEEAETRAASQAEVTKQAEEELQAHLLTLEVVKHFTEPVDA